MLLNSPAKVNCQEQEASLTRTFDERTSPRWLHFVELMKASTRPDLQAETWPTPPREIVGRTGGGLTPEKQLHSGAVNWLNFARAFEDNGFDFSGKRVLEFGCGGGRVLRGFAGYKPGLSLVGCDIDGPTIEWNARELTFADWKVNQAAPPAPFAPESLDAIYAFSVFSHLPMQRHFSWLDDIARMLKPGGMATLTKMGGKCWHLYESGQRPNSRPSPQELEGHHEKWLKKGFAFFPLNQIFWATAQTADYYSTVDLAEYGNTFITDDFVRAYWRRSGLELVELRPHPDEWQDYVVLRKSGT